MPDLSRYEFDRLHDEMQEAMQQVAKKYGIESLEFDDYIGLWLEEHVTITGPRLEA